MQLIVQLISLRTQWKHIKEAAGNIWDGVKNLPGKALDAAVDAVKNTPAAMIVSKIPNPIGEANAKEITPELKAPVNSHQRHLILKLNPMPNRLILLPA